MRILVVVAKGLLTNRQVGMIERTIRGVARRRRLSAAREVLSGGAAKQKFEVQEGPGHRILLFVHSCNAVSGICLVRTRFRTVVSSYFS